jgi:hypothetical protein
MKDLLTLGSASLDNDETFKDEEMVSYSRESQIDVTDMDKERD